MRKITIKSNRINKQIPKALPLKISLPSSPIGPDCAAVLLLASPDDTAIAVEPAADSPPLEPVATTFKVVAVVPACVAAVLVGPPSTKYCRLLAPNVT